MKQTESNPLHPGIYVKDNIIPKDVTITKASCLMGIGRSALSNFLNGKSSLSKEMALRLERTFGADREKLLEMQTRYELNYDIVQSNIVASTHSPKLIPIKANDIENWSKKIESRSELSVLLRQLVRSTVRSLTRVDFPAYENSERPGWDGVVETSTPTPWVPDGRSGWEFGCGKSPEKKANSDYQARTKHIRPEERHRTSFVFVTPRNWTNKRLWETAKTELDDWKEVRAYDASDIEQWLEQSASTQIWFAERLGKPIKGLRSLAQCWSNWAEACDPILSQKLFNSAVQDFTQLFRNWIENEPKKPFIVTADSGDEALAFLYCLIERIGVDADEPCANAIVFDSSDALKQFELPTDLSQISVVHTPDVEENLGGLYRKCHCVIVRPSNKVNSAHIQPDFCLGILERKDFESALFDMGIAENCIRRLVRESAGSPTILRRCLTTIPEIKIPAWAKSSEFARILLPMTLVGSWNNVNSADREIVRLLADVSNYDTVDNRISKLLALEDTPLWSEGDYRGVISRTDSLFGISQFIKKTDIENFLIVAEIVLSESDPAIDMPIGHEWAAHIYGKVRDHSDTLRGGIRESLILLSEFGDNIFDQNLGIDAEKQISKLIRNLLTPFDRSKLLSHKFDLPDYAEAAPDLFVSLVESDLTCNKPTIRELMLPSGIVPFTSPNCTYLLWALECLAWNPSFFPRVVKILVNLCKITPSDNSDNWANKPVNTLISLFQFEIPNTNATQDQKKLAFQNLCTHDPSIGWQICMSLLDPIGSFVAMNHRARWRNKMFGSNCKLIESHEPSIFETYVVDIALTRTSYDEKMLKNLIERLYLFAEEDQLRIWNLIDQWNDSKPSDEAKAFLRNHIRSLCHSDDRDQNTIFHYNKVQSVSEKLLPSDLATRHAWLFDSFDVRLPIECSEGKKLKIENNELRLNKLRMIALREIWENRGFEGVVALLDQAKFTEQLIGELICKILTGDQKKLEFVEECLSAAIMSDSSLYRSCLVGVLRNVNSDIITNLIEKYECESDSLFTLFLCLPFRNSTWDLLDNMDENLQKKYWKKVEPRLVSVTQTEEEINRLIDELLAADRTLVAFHSVYVNWDKVETSRLNKLLSCLATVTLDEILDDSMISKYLPESFHELDKRSGLTVDEKARLEFALFPLLENSRHGIPNLERLITDSPEEYVSAIRCICKRGDGADDFSELGLVDEEQRKNVRLKLLRILSKVGRIPGTNKQGEIDSDALNDWLRLVRDLLQKYDRVEVGDQYIGRILANASADEDGVWPCRPVCVNLERVASAEIGRGFIAGIQNLRGAHFRTEGGDQEREIAERYRNWASLLVHEYSYVGSLLENIAASYDNQANWEDNRLNVRKRLEY